LAAIAAKIANFLREGLSFVVTAQKGPNSRGIFKSRAFLDAIVSKNARLLH
jgi:hypothetical protein